MRRYLFAVALTAAVVVGQVTPFEFYGPELGLASLSIEAITQDPDKTLWVGTRGGIFRYDGDRFEQFSEQHGLPSPRIQAMLNFESRFWVATERGIAIWNGSSFSVPAGATPIAQQSVFALAVSNGRLFAGTSQGLWQIGIQNSTILDPHPVYALHAEPGGPLWTAGPEGVWRFDPATNVARREGADLPQREWRGIATSRDGLLWLRASGELWSGIPGQQFSLARSLVRTTDYLSLFRTPEGWMMAPSLNGVLIWRDGTWESLDETAGLYASWSSCVYWDHENNLWVGLPSFGVTRERGGGNWILWTAQRGLPHSTITAVAQDWQGRVWAGTPAGIALPARAIIGQPSTVIGTRQGLPAERISAMVGDNRGGLWAGYDFSGIVRYDLASNRIVRLGPRQGLESEHVFALRIDPSGNLWAATQEGLFRLPGSDPKMRFERVQELPSAVYDVAFSDGVAWAATDRGVWRHQDGVWTRFDRNQGLAENEVRFVSTVRDGSVWVGFANQGVARLTLSDGKLQVEPFPLRVPSQSNDLTFVTADSRGWIWVGHKRGVDLYANGAWRPFSFQSGIALADTQTGAFTVDGDGAAWIGTTGGLSYYSPPDDMPAPVAPDVTLLTTQFAAPAAAGDSELQVPWRGRTLTVYFAPSTFENSELAILRYRLADSRRGWTETTQHSVTFANLGAGSHRLELAASIDGIHWTDPPRTLAFRISPPWWRWYAIGLSIVTGALVVIIAWVIRMRSHVALRRQLENEIAQQEQSLDLARRRAGEMDRRFRSLLEDVRLATLIFDRQGQVTFCNDHFLALTGWPRDKVIGQNWIDTFIPLEDRETMRARFSVDVLDAYSGDHYEGSVLTAGGDMRILQWSTTPLRENGEMTGIAAIGADVTEQRKLDEQIRQIQKMESLGRLAGGVAHDFNNLLTVINGYADLVLRKLPPENALRRQVEEIRKAGERGFEITQQMLIFSRKQPIQPAPLSLNQVTRDSKSLIERVLGENMSLRLKLAPKLGHIRGDTGQMCQILLNLAANARDAMPQGGTLTIETSDEDSGMVRLSVIDTGTGMDERTRNHIFEPFFTTKESGRGTGLGLATVYGIVQQGGGSIEVQTAPGEGARFDILLPRVPDPASSASAPAAVHLPHREGKVLVVENDPVVKEFVAEVLKASGFEVTTASTGAEAIRSIQEPFDLLLTDVIMPGMSGRQLAARFREQCGDLPVLFMSGYADSDLGEERAALDGIQFLPKPFLPAELVYRVRQVMEAEKGPSYSSNEPATGRESRGLGAH